MDLIQLQREHDEWEQRNFPADRETRAVHAALGVAEETGELCHAVLKRAQGIRGTEDQHLAKAADAIGDVVVYLAGVASALNLSLAACVTDSWNEVKERDWLANRQDGAVGR